MAILSELVTTVAKVSGMDQATVALIARHAREAGLIAMSGRGPSAASMGPTDAANLLIAVNTTKHASEVARAIPLYRTLVAQERDARGYRHAIEAVGTLGEVIEQLISAAAVGIFPDPLLGRKPSKQMKDDFARSNVQMVIRFNVSFVAAALRFVTPTPGDGLPDYPPLDSAPVVAAFDFFPPIRGQSRKEVGVRSRGAYVLLRGATVANRIEETIIGHRTIQAVGQLIAPTTV
jgi:hypothetical protein